MKPTDVAEIREGARLMNLAPYVNPEIEQAMRAVENSVLMLIQKGELTPERAQEKWMEWAAYKRIMQRFNQKINVAIDKGRLLDNQA